MKITRELLTRIGECGPALTAFVERFPGGLDVTGEPDPEVVARWVEVPTSVARLALTVLKNRAYGRYDKDTRRTADAIAAFPQDEVNTRREAHIAVFDAHRLACGLSLWRLLADPNNILQEYR